MSDVTGDQNLEGMDDWDLEFGFEEDQVKVAGGAGKSPLFPVEAQVSGVKLAKVEHGVNDNGSHFVEFTFQRHSDGTKQELDGREYKVNKTDEPYLLRGEDKTQAIIRKGKEFNGRLLEIAKAFGVDVSASGTLRTKVKTTKNFKDFIDKYAEIILEEGKGSAVMKVMRNPKGYPCFPKYGEMIQAEVEGQESSLSYSLREEEINEKNKGVPGGIQDDDDIDDAGSGDSDDFADDDVISPSEPAPSESGDEDDDWIEN